MSTLAVKRFTGFDTLDGSHTLAIAGTVVDETQGGIPYGSPVSCTWMMYINSNDTWEGRMQIYGRYTISTGPLSYNTPNALAINAQTASQVTGTGTKVLMAPGDNITNAIRYSPGSQVPITGDGFFLRLYTDVAGTIDIENQLIVHYIRP